MQFDVKDWSMIFLTINKMPNTLNFDYKYPVMLYYYEYSLIMSKLCLFDNWIITGHKYGYVHARMYKSAVSG